jgi:hypothetical protein
VLRFFSRNELDPLHPGHDMQVLRQQDPEGAQGEAGSKQGISRRQQNGRGIQVSGFFSLPVLCVADTQKAGQ